ncbi:hypothetical protein HMPREF9581_01298 [Cutibacterium acnes HL087PA3]|nr:hypothetical protein HMPREF9581_01298 [Cutibacterium acnes HL087PA3]
MTPSGRASHDLSWLLILHILDPGTGCDTDEDRRRRTSNDAGYQLP